MKLGFFNRLKKSVLAVPLLLTASFANAVIIESELTDLGGGSFQYDFNIINDDIAAGIENFSIYFDFTLYDNLMIVASPADWDSIVFQPDPFLPDDGIFDSLALVDPIALGDNLDGFSVSVDWLGTAPAPTEGLLFDIFNANFDIVGSGSTPNIPGTPVPEPGILALFGLSLLLMRRKFS